MTAAGTEHPQQDDGSFGLATESQTAETEQLLAAEGEQRQTFAIKSVVNPADGTDISLQQAIMLGVIQPDEGVYVNSTTGDRKPIPTAMSEGLIKVCRYNNNNNYYYYYLGYMNSVTGVRTPMRTAVSESFY